MTLLYAYQSRRFEANIPLVIAGDTITPAAADTIRITIHHRAETTNRLQFDSTAATANGSSITKNSPANGRNALVLDPLDLAFDPGVYTLQVDFKDNDGGADWEHAGIHLFILGVP